MLRLKSQLRDLYRRHKKRMVLSALVSGFTTIAGFTLLYVTVSLLEWNQLWANFPIAAVMGAMGFFLNWCIIWHDRHTELRSGANRWTIKSLLFAAASHGSYLSLVGIWDMPYWQVKAGIICVLGPLSFVVNNFCVFPEKEWKFSKILYGLQAVPKEMFRRLKMA